MLENVVASGLPPIKQVSIEVSAEEAARSASVDCVITGSGVPVSIGQPVTLTASGDLVLTGFVRDINTGYSQDMRTLGVTIFSKTIDMVECSADHPTGEWVNMDIAAIAKDLDKFGVGIEADGKFPAEPVHRLIPGESPFATIERRARGRGILIHDTEKGRLKLSTKPDGMHAGRLQRGVNIRVGASASFTERDRYSEVKVRGQSSDGVGKAQLRPEATAKDPGIPRHRPLVLWHEGEVTVDRLKKRAEWASNRAAGQSVTASIPVSGWRDAAGKLWQANYLVDVFDDWLGIEGTMIIKSVTFIQNDTDGTLATLSLADPRSLGGDNPRGKTAASYSAPGKIVAEYNEQ
ncbi:prophage tail gpP-like protein [Neorhizobium galegae]|uniref:phage baseplate assembly protein n=1 Tax=Neorhizobium galegae TaxID=399 RepID=UPI001AE7FA01|nr:hypothetical protein [Neorhizobium galegae]MBP2560854.1 prophage tail gpP-like protein [Neorhizobium galegae]